MDLSINCNGRLLNLAHPQVMGILNVTPDSFFAGSRKQAESEIAQRTNQIIAEGGSMIDVGAFSTRPGASQVSSEEEMARLRMALSVVRREQPYAIVSVDTFRPEVARMVVEEFGVDIINDVSEGDEKGAYGAATRLESHQGQMADDGKVPAIFQEVARLGVPYILMSTHGTLKETLMAFSKEVQQLRDLGQKDIILDPGFGFGKTLEQNYQLMNELDKLSVMQLPLLVGISRKSMIWKVLGNNADEALNGSTALHTIALMKGASILRVHDVKEAVEINTKFMPRPPYFSPSKYGKKYTICFFHHGQS